jgi:magnesium-transporting ATPase (P-type)
MNGRDKVEIDIPSPIVQEGTKIKSTITLYIILQAVSNIGVLIINKLITSQFKNRLLLISIQNISILLILLILHYFNNYKEFKPFSLKQFRKLILSSFFYVLINWTTLEGLKRVNIPLMLVTRNTVP